MEIFRHKQAIHIITYTCVSVLSLLIIQRWANLKKLASERKALLDKALKKGCFHDNWKKESDWIHHCPRAPRTVFSNFQ